MEHSYDYIVAGSGPAGSVLARLLSDRGRSVLLLEAGAYGDRDELIRSANSNLYDHFPEYFWPGQSVPQRNTNSRSFNLTGGRVSGGGSSINGEMYVRPTPYVLNQWQKMGGPQWSPERATRHFIELENFHGTPDDSSAHGTGGLLDIRLTYPDPPALSKKLVSSIAEATGRAPVQDFNNPVTPIGPFHNWQLYQRPNGDRASASACFLSGASPFLTVRYRSTVLRVLFDEAKNANGVAYLFDGQMETARAGERVILSAGINSVKLLMLSGIGPEDALRAAGVPVRVVNENVGRHWAGDAYMTAAFHINPKDSAALREADPNGKFPGGAFLPGFGPDASPDQRSIQLIPSQVYGSMLYMSVLCVNPKSTGTLKIQSSDPLKIMLGDFGFLSEPDDLKTLMKAAREYIAPIADALHRLDPAYVLAAPSSEALSNDDKLEQYIRGSFIHTYHDQCELRMGSEQDGVVNGYGEVYGVERLTVADASIIPYHMDGNTSACAYLIGHTVAKHLLGEE